MGPCLGRKFFRLPPPSPEWLKRILLRLLYLMKWRVVWV